MSGHPTGPATGERVRDAIDAGLTGDKIPYADPAAAPLGTDAEAAGNPPQPGEAPPQPAAAIPEGHAKGHELPARTTLGIGVAAALVAAAVALVVAVVLL
nr:hypothetical protein [Azospirillum oleiclasticum]